jgi:hypothetical protein
VLICAVGFIDPDRLLMNYSYPLPTHDAPAPVQYSSSSDAVSAATTTYSMGYASQIGINFPLRVSGIENGAGIVNNAARVTIEAPDGFHWDSSWQSQSPRDYLPRDKGAAMSFSMPAAVYDKYKSVPLTMHITLALTEMKVDKVTRIPLPQGDFSVPGFGICTLSTYPYRSTAGFLWCGSAMPPTLTHVSAHWSNAPCPAGQTGADIFVAAEPWGGSLDPAPATINVLSTRFHAAIADETKYTKGETLCLGTPITFTQYKPVRRTQTSLTIQEVILKR